ncbi:flagellar assembly peptidoglycan hydrolase FlgJ [Rhodoferax sp.]|uniref:flagellar assembly peptidoglycan hydrolase FlgJ n=1 Tax=Rhodoferax sp. TaxID=50421 RepID=UPI0027315F7B|nr:flagellar assembly peptidoglycan hydrolase FlgJ [Rhodoferax sp.]MDP1530433.1 flagellar assembly peptidoglycan hydrolase FlgJ [Rhodoferax sp.]MDP1943221.1 flagellar assembly peptidoglycan hydrolase FlgJ [Rhodoferax sp.]MDP2442735.1 flagellar assembly peptidoglycan hydrolase FlgJ [Rhodoferax sp.]MDZ4206381.1 flagellar assembly peptidoglycan hydrolase FlgJ [Rhodoferax sp.]
MSSSGFSSLNGVAPAAGGVLDQRLSLDVQGVDALRRTVRNSPEEGMKQAAKQFEVMFMQIVLKSMRDATPTEGLLGSQQEKMYTSMLDQQLTQNLSGRGLGLAEAMLAQLSRAMGTEAAPAPEQLTPAHVAPVAPAAARPLAPAPDLAFYEAAAAPATPGRRVGPQAHVEQFVERMLPAARRASEASGIPAQLIMAQAALESGWGRREIHAADGRNSFNLFGIKADKSWNGPVAETSTTEYVNGTAQKTRAAFRAYGSYEEAFTDYARFLLGNPRYANVLATDNPVAAAHDLQRAGYATDPAYGGKLVRIMQQMS